MTIVASQTLARFVEQLDFAAIPDRALRSARQCVVDTVAVANFGARFPWTQAIASYGSRYGSGGNCRVFGRPDLRLTAPFAALVNGASAHAFELDSLRFPGAGVHPGATLLPPALAIAQEESLDGKALLTAFVAGCEVMFRIGRASHHSSESLGFHAPGLTGPFGSAVVASKLLGLNAEQIANAMGIAGSLCAGVLAFTKANTGAMVKRLHLGRAAEAGVTAARLAQNGLTGPETILEGKFGFLDVYCKESDAAELTAALGERWECETICLKRFPCHITAHTPVQCLIELMHKSGLRGTDIESIEIEGSAKLLTHHGNQTPADIMQAQYSVPFCVALAAFRDADNPASFDESAVADRDIRALALRVHLRAASAPLASSWATRLHIRLVNGTSITAEARSFKGMPDNPLSDEQLKNKFVRLADGVAGIATADTQRSWEKWSDLDARDSMQEVA